MFQNSMQNGKYSSMLQDGTQQESQGSLGKGVGSLSLRVERWQSGWCWHRRTLELNPPGPSHSGTATLLGDHG